MLKNILLFIFTKTFQSIGIDANQSEYKVKELTLNKKNSLCRLFFLINLLLCIIWL